MNLKSLGLSDYEEKAYTALVKLGKSKASQISKESGVSYGRIYEVLGSLDRKGLVKTVPERTKMFVPADPGNLMEIINNKEKKLLSMRKEVTKLKQFYETHEEEVVKMAHGRWNFFKMIKAREPPKTFKYSIKYTSEPKPEGMRMDKKLITQGIDVKVLARYDQETQKHVNKWLKINTNIKKIKNSGATIGIVDSEIVIGLIKSNVTLSIKDKAFVELMKDLFLEEYNHAKLIE